jgi:hypothetical protein
MVRTMTFQEVGIIELVRLGRRQMPPQMTYTARVRHGAPGVLYVDCDFYCKSDGDKPRCREFLNRITGYRATPVEKVCSVGISSWL